MAARRVDSEALEIADEGAAAGNTVIFGFGRVGQMVADMLDLHKRPYLAVENDIDAVLAAREGGYKVLFGDVARGTLVEKLQIGNADALVLTMDDPVLIVRLARRIRGEHPDLPIIARARDTGHAAQLYRAGVTDAVRKRSSVAPAVRGGAGRHRPGDGPGDRVNPRKAQRIASGNHGTGRTDAGATDWPAAVAGCSAAGLSCAFLQRVADSV